MTASSLSSRSRYSLEARELRRVERPARAPRNPASRLVADELLDRDALRQRIDRQPRLAELQRQRTASRDLDRVLQRLGDVGKQLAPFPAASAGTAPRCTGATRAGSASCVPSAMHTRASCDSKSAGGEEAHVVGGDHRNAGLLAERDAAGDVRFIVGAAEPLQLEVVAIAEQLLPVARQRQRLGFAAAGDARGRRRPRRRRTARSARPWSSASSQLAIDERHAAVLAFEPGARDQVGDVLVSARILAQQREPRRAPRARRACAAARPRR